MCVSIYSACVFTVCVCVYVRVSVCVCVCICLEDRGEAQTDDAADGGGQGLIDSSQWHLPVQPGWQESIVKLVCV